MDIQDKSTESMIVSYFPFSTVSEIAYKESNAKRFYRPVLTLGKWFARRLGSVFRSILIYAALNTSEDINQDKNNEWEKFWDLYLKEHSFQNLSVLDPFMGGGTTIIEAIRLGYGQIIGGDLNPIAWFIVKKEIEEVDIVELETNFKMMASRLKPEILKYYKTKCVDCSNPADVMYFFWIKEIKCDKCTTPVSLYRSYLFAYDKKNPSSAFFICPKCEWIFQAKSNKNLMCPKCNYNFNSSTHNAKHGKYICFRCGYSASIIETSAKQGRPVERLYAIEYYCNKCNIRKFKRVEEEDIKLYNQAYAEFKQVEDNLPIPDQEIPMGAKTQELLNHRILYFKQMFNQRQLLSLGKLLNEILKIKDQNIKEFFLISFIAALEYNNLLCEYHRKNHYIYNLFRKHAFPATLNPVENNVWGTKYGTGTFRNFFEKTIRIKRYCKTPYEYYITDTGETKRKPMKRSIKGNIVSSYNELLGDPLGKIFLYCDSSHEISIPNYQIDLVITDPPYYDNVQYAELSDFYYVWLRLALKSHYPWFSSPLSPKKAEVVKNVKMGKTSEDYQEGLQAIFKEVSRVLKPKGLLILTFHHKKTQAWISLIQSLLNNNFYITSVYPVRAEMKTSTQIRGTRSIEYDAILVCQQRSNLEKKDEISWEEMVVQIKDNVKVKLLELTNNGAKISDEDQIVIQLGVGLKYFTQNYPNPSYPSLSEMLEFLSFKF